MSYPDSLREEARQRYERGLVREQDVADQLGVSKATVHRWLYPKFEDVERIKARARKFHLGGKCIDCGKPTSKKRIGEPNKRCRSCQLKHMGRERYWTQEKIVAAIQLWVDRHGEVPFSRDWDKAGEDHPCIWTVCRSEAAPFASWAEAVTEAGFRPRRASIGVRKATKRRREGQKQALAKALVRKVNQDAQ